MHIPLPPSLEAVNKILNMVNMTNSSTLLEASEPLSVQGALSQEEHRALSFTAVLVLTSLFAFFTLSITGAILIFCKKKNSVFALQKCEQESDIDYELDDLNSTEIEMSDEEPTGSGTKRSATYPDLKIVCNRNYRPPSVRDVGKSETENHRGGKTEIPRAHTFSFEKYEYTPIALNVPSTEGGNNGGARTKTRVKGTRAGYHQLQTCDRDSIDSHTTSIGELECEDEKLTESIYLTEIDRSGTKNCGIGPEDSKMSTDLMLQKTRGICPMPQKKYNAHVGRTDKINPMTSILFGD